MVRIVCALIVALIGLLASDASAQSYPNRPITIVNPFPPGGLVDLSGRPFAAALERVLKNPVVLTNKNPVVLTNKPGAAGAVGTQSVAVAKPDGYTLGPPGWPPSPTCRR